MKRLWKFVISHVSVEKFWILSTIGPVIALLLAIGFIPMGYAIWLSFHSRDAFSPTVDYVGLQNYITLFTNPKFLASLGRSLQYTIVSVIFQTLMGLGIALLFVRPFRGQLFARTVVFLPYLLPTAVVGLIFSWLLSTQYGVVNQLLSQLGLIKFPITFLDGLKSAMYVVVGSGSWKFGMFCTIMFIARLQAIPKSLYEAAQISGAGAFRCFLDVTLPHLKSTLLLIVLLRGIWMFNKFDMIWILTKGGPLRATEILPIFSYRLAFEERSFGLAAAASVVILLILAITATFYFWYFKPGKEVEVE